MAGRLRILSLAATVALLGAGLGLATAANATQTAAPNDVLLSQGKPTKASSTRPGFPAKNAVDGKTSTKWRSNALGTQWISVDLGAVQPIVRVRLAWDGSCARTYQIQTSPGNAVWTTVFRTTKGNGGVDDIAVTGTARRVRLLMTHQCVNPPGRWYGLRELQVYGPPEVPVPPPGHPHVIEITCTTVTIGWDPSPVPLSGVEVFNNGQLVAQTSGNATRIVVTGLRPNTSYVLELVAIDANGNASMPSTPIEVTTPRCGDPLPPTAPTHLRVVGVTRTCVTLEWDPAQDNVVVVGYHIYSANAVVGQSATTRATICGLSPSTAYVFTVTAVDEDANESPHSNAVEAVTAA
jgi:chitodextrinase